MLATIVLAVAFPTANPLSFPSYGQEIVATFASADEATGATCRIAPLPDDAKLALSCRWDDCNKKHLSKGEMMVRAGVAGTFYLNAKEDWFVTGGARELMEKGFSLGNHSFSHPKLWKRGADVAFREVASGRVRLELLLGRTVISYAAPYGWKKQGVGCQLPAFVVASGHFLSGDAPERIAWAGLDARTLMPTRRFGADDRNPVRELFVTGFEKETSAARNDPLVPRVFFGIHSRCDAAGEARQEAWLKEFFHPADAVSLNDWQYGAYRYQHFHGGVAKSGVTGVSATFRVTRYEPAFVGDGIALSLVFSSEPKAVKLNGKPLERGLRGTWKLPQDPARNRPLKIADAFADVTVEVTPDESAGKLRVRVANGGTESLKRLFVAAALPPRWTVRRVTAEGGTLSAGQAFERTFDLGGAADPKLADGEAYYPVSVDFIRGGTPHRLWKD